MTIQGYFITIEGADGLGKSTQGNLLTQAFLRAQQPIISTREPGGTTISEQIRTLLTVGAAHSMLPLTELLLMNAARCEHVERLIRPALAAGTHVLSDRYIDSTLIYQGAGHHLSEPLIWEMHRIATQMLMPDLTLVLVAPPEVAEDRLHQRETGKPTSASKENRFEKMGKAFYERIYHGFQTLPETFPERCVAIHAAGTAGEIHGQILRVIQAKLGLSLPTVLK